MTVPKKALEKWLAIRSPEDTEKIAKDANVSKVTIQTAFNTGVCNDRVFEVMAKFYNAKAEKIKELI